MLYFLKQILKDHLNVWVHSRLFWLGFAFVIGSLIFLLGLNGYSEAYRIKTENVFAGKKAIAVLAANAVHDKINYLLSLGASFVSRPMLIQGVSQGDWGRAMDDMALVPRFFPFIEQVSLFDNKGVLKAQFPEGDDVKVSGDPSWYKNFIKDRKPYLSGIYLRRQESQKTFVSVFIPVWLLESVNGYGDTDFGLSDGMAGILQLQVTTDFFASGLQVSAEKLGLTAFIMDQRGQSLFYSGVSDRDTTTGSAMGSGAAHLLLGLEGVGVFKDPTGTEERVEAFSLIHDHRWGVVITQPVKKAFAERDRELQGLAWGYFLYVLLLLLSGGMVGFYVIERRRSRKSLEHLNEALQEQTRSLICSNKELEQFAYVVSHDLQEPLRMVASFTQLLARKYKDKIDDQGRTYIAFIIDGALRMQNLIEDLLVFSRCGQKDVLYEAVDLDQICRQILKDVSVPSEEQHASITWDSLPVIKANTVQMTHLFLNLVTNALKYHSEKPVVIRITAQAIKPKGWQFSVADNGIGIDPKNFSKLFVIFQRLHSRETYEGTGIGLALCKKIVENYKGCIWLESALGQGTTFYFTLYEQEDT